MIFRALKDDQNTFNQLKNKLDKDVQGGGILTNDNAKSYKKNFDNLEVKISLQMERLFGLGLFLAGSGFMAVLINIGYILSAEFGNEPWNYLGISLGIFLVGCVYVDKYEWVKRNYYSYRTTQNTPDIHPTVKRALEYNVLSKQDRERLVNRPYLFDGEQKYMSALYLPLQQRDETAQEEKQLLERKETLLGVL